MIVGLVATGAIVVGALLARAGQLSPRTAVAVRSVSVAAILTSLMIHVLPESLHETGALGLALFVAAAGLPSMLQGGEHSHADHRAFATRIGLVGIALHQFGDGFVLGALSGDWAVVGGIAMHTIPLVAALTIGLLKQYGMRGAALRLFGLATVTWAGLGTSRLTWFEAYVPWIILASAGLLLHVIVHDIPSGRREREVWGSLVETTATLGGIGIALFMTFLEQRTHGEAGHGHSEHAGDAVHELGSMIWRLAPAAALAWLCGMVAVYLLRSQPLAWLGRRSVDVWKVPFLAPLLPLAAAREDGGLGVVRGSPVLVLTFVISASLLGFELWSLTLLTMGPSIAWFRAAVVFVAAVASAAVASRWIRQSQAPRRQRDDHSEDASRCDEYLIHHMPPMLAGLGLALLIHLAVGETGLQLTTWWHELLVLGTIVAPGFLSAGAAVPVSLALLEAGAPLELALLGLMVGAIGRAQVSQAILRTFGPNVTALASLGYIGVVWLLCRDGALEPLGIAIATWDLPALVHWISLTLLATAAARLLWRYGLSAWLEPLHGGHGHHQHDVGEPCADDCHDHALAPSGRIVRLSTPPKFSL